MGSDPIALPMLQALVSTHAEAVELVAVFTQPDRRKGRGMKTVANAIKQWAEAQGIPVLQPTKPDAETVTWFKAQGIALALVMAYGHILKRDLLATPPLGLVNFHASLLPKLRGASPIETAVATGESETGVTLMRVDPKMDAGPVLETERVAITAADTAPAMREKLAAACPALLARGLPKLLSGQVEWQAQDETAVTYCRMLTKEDAALDFNHSAAELAARVRGLTPWPGTAFLHEGQTIKIGKAEVCGDESGTPGRVIQQGNSLEIETRRGRLRCLELQRPGGKMLPVADFLRGYYLAEGTALESQPMPPLVAKEPFHRKKPSTTP